MLVLIEQSSRRAGLLTQDLLQFRLVPLLSLDDSVSVVVLSQAYKAGIILLASGVLVDVCWGR
jgi:hypothetical protein